jgi:hypothetical protein
VLSAKIQRSALQLFIISFLALYFELIVIRWLSSEGADLCLPEEPSPDRKFPGSWIRVRNGTQRWQRPSVGCLWF